MEYLPFLMDRTMRNLVRRIAQNDPTMTELFQPAAEFNVDLSLALGHALIGNTHLHQLRLMNLVLTEEAAHALAQGMAQSKVKVLSLVGFCQEHPSHDLSLQGRICDIFYRGIQASSTIQSIRLDQTLINEPGDAWKNALLGIVRIIITISNRHGYVQAFSEVLSRATLLKELTIILPDMEADDVTILAHSICQNTSVTNLRLENYCLNTQQSQLLFAQRPSPNSSITKLQAPNCRINDGCIKLLVDCWLPNCPMEYLDLSVHKIGPTGAQHLMQAVAAHPTLLNLYLRGNYNIGYKGLRLIGNELPNLQHLTNLNLNHCSTWNDVLEAESREAKAQTTALQQAGEALLDGIKRNCSVTTLLVYGNGFPQEVMAGIHFYCALNGVGHYLLSADGNHGVAPSVWCHVFVECQRQPYIGTSLVYFYLTELPTLVQSRSLLKRKRCWES